MRLAVLVNKRYRSFFAEKTGTDVREAFLFVELRDRLEGSYLAIATSGKSHVSRRNLPETVPGRPEVKATRPITPSVRSVVVIDRFQVLFLR